MNAGQLVEAPYSIIGRVEGFLDHPAWTSAPPIQITHLWSGQEAPASRHAETRIIWSEEFLGVRFCCNQNEPLIVSTKPHLHRKTIGLWNRDVCEIFLAPDPDNSNQYFEFEAAPTGEWVDIAINHKSTHRESDFDFQSGMAVSTHLNAHRLVIGMRIPWSNSIPKPRSGDEWRVNLFRCIGNGDDRYLAWLPTYTPEPNFHVPEAFGRLKFG